MLSTALAAAPGLPSSMSILDRPTPRRGFLAGLGALPLLGGSLAFATRHGNAPGTAGDPDAEPMASIDDYADASFLALEVDCEAARAAHLNMWTPLAIGLQFMKRSPDQCRDVAVDMHSSVEMVEALVETLSDGAAWYRQAADIIEAAQLRYLSGEARRVKEGESAGGADA